MIIEDSVHRLVNPIKINLLNDRHFIIDSLRKVSPLPGSRLFGRLDFPQTRQTIFNLYFLQSIFYFLLFRFILVTGFITNSSRLTAWSHEHLLKIHDDIVGDSLIPQPGLPVFEPFINHLDYAKVLRRKISQVKLYDQILAPLFRHKLFYRVSIPESDYGQLHVYPLGLTSVPTDKLITYLHAKGIPVWSKFPDSPWSQNQGVLFLPLGFHVSESEISLLGKCLFDY